MKKITYILLGITITACQAPKKEISDKKDIQLKPYPEVKKDSIVDNYFGTLVADPYRWLENDTSEETAQWVKAQNEVTFDYLAQIPYREQIEDRLTELWNYERLGTPFKRGK